ncbi:MAG TPA: hypothetical protein VGX23_16585 [Actinocrinis sp.]|nr:hypothetical protein [Actinocrinis sp.]
MERRALASAAANYPYLQGLWAVPMGFMMVATGISNLQGRLSGPVIIGVLVGCFALCVVTTLLIARYYSANYGRVTPTTGRHLRHGVAVATWAAVLFVGANRYLLWSPDSTVCAFAAAFAAATLAYYAILVGLRAHHLVVWGVVVLAALLPVWGPLGADRDAVAMFPLAAALVASGLLDQRALARTFGAPRTPNPKDGNVGG